MQMDFAEVIRTRGAQWTIMEDPQGARSRTRAQAVTEVLRLLKKSRGRELPGLPNPLLVGEVFREYSQPWEGIARKHIVEVWNAARAFLERVLEHLTDPAVGDMLLRLWLDPRMDECLRLANIKLDELIAVRVKDPITTNHYFRDKISKIQLERSQASLTRLLKQLFKQHEGQLDAIHIPLIVATVHPKMDPDMDKVAAQDIFDCMNAFYKVYFQLLLLMINSY